MNYLSTKNFSFNFISYLFIFVLMIAVAFLFFFDENQTLANNWIFNRGNFVEKKIVSLSYLFFHQNVIQLSFNLSSLLLIIIFLGKVFESAWWLPALLLSGVTSALGVFFYDLETNLIYGLSASIHGLFFYGLLYLRVSFIWFLILFCKLILDVYLNGFFSLIISNIYNTSELYFTPPYANIFGLVGGFLIYAISRSLSFSSLLIEINKQE